MLWETTRVAFEAAWGRCWEAEGNIEVLIALPYNDLMPCGLREVCPSGCLRSFCLCTLCV